MKLLAFFIAIHVLLFVAGCATVKQPWDGQTFAHGAQQTTDQAHGHAHAASTSADSELGLVNTLVDRLGINSEQALGGAGSIFALAQQRMSPDDFMRLSSSIPDMERYLSSVPRPRTSNAWLGSVADVTNDETRSLGKLAALTGSFQTLGMDAKMINQFVPVVLQYVQGQNGGLYAMNLLQGALY